MELIERYIYAVVRLQPEKQRDDIEKELHSLIDDMLAERTGDTPPTEEDIQAVLKELGEPSALAAKYSGKPQFLIGPELYDMFCKIAKIVPLAAAFGTLIALVTNYALAPTGNLDIAISTILSSILSSAVEAFGIVTLIFALVERSAAQKGKELRKKKEWNPADLPEIPKRRTVIKPSEPIVGLAFIIIFCIIFNLAPSLFSVYFSNVNVRAVTIFNLDILKTYLPLINISFALSFIREILKLVYGRYDIKLASAALLLNTVSFILTMIVLSNIMIWNPDFGSTLQQVFHTVIPTGNDIQLALVFFSRIILGIFIFSFVVDTLSILWKTAGSRNIKNHLHNIG